MKISSARFITSNTDPGKCPEPDRPEYAFIGRSNVGKSSLLNMLAGHKSLAKTSGKPGKTKTINHFLINDSWYLVDLPGYGYAKASKTERQKWVHTIHLYLQTRQNLMYLFVLIDSRMPPQAIDLEFIHMLGEWKIPFVLLFTKTDKSTKNKLKKTIDDYQLLLLEDWESLPKVYSTSAIDKRGREEILNLIEQTNKDFKTF